MKTIFKNTLLLFLLISMAACAKGLLNAGGGNQKITDAYGCSVGPSAPAVNEASYCSNIVSPSDPVSITGTAIYKRRTMNTSGLHGESATDYPIREAEIAVINSSGTVIQCGETDASGNFSVAVPRSSESYVLQVRSRSNNSSLKASILNNHGDMNFYSVNSEFVADSSKSIGSLSAKYNGSLEGGAFNILDKLYEANDFLRNNTAGCSAISGCTDFSVAPKVQVFWEKGCNPGAYFNASPVSFYLPGNSRMYILGGDEGDVDYSDTDHFDDIIVLHEYGHFLEDIYSKSDSPGGFHDANTITDPRLAWSEAWASFLAARVQDLSFYIDTYGNSSGATGTYFSYDMERNLPNKDPDIVYTVPSGEGNYREFGILRALWDILDADADPADFDNDGVAANFYEVWAAFSGTNGIKSKKFADAGAFFEVYNDIAGVTPVSSVLSTEKILSRNTSPADADNRLYASKLKSVADGGTECTISITPSSGNGVTENGNPNNSNLFASNDFYHFNVPSSGTQTIQLSIVSGSGDLDLILFPEDHSLSSSSTGVRYDAIASSITRSSTGTESITRNLSAGDYLINVHSYTGSGLNSNTYQIHINGVLVCL